MQDNLVILSSCHPFISLLPQGHKTKISDDLLAFCAQGRVRPVIETTYPLDAVRDALERLESGEQFGKLALRIV